MTVEKFECQERKETRIAALKEKIKFLQQAIETLLENKKTVPDKIIQQKEAFEKELAAQKLKLN